MFLEPSDYRLGVGMMLLNAENKVFVGQRRDNSSEAWQMPQGGMDPNEDPLETALRELTEETGVDSSKVEVIMKSKEWYSYDLPLELIPRLWGGKYRGQKQKWYLMRFLGKDSDINIYTEDPEFQAWRWIEPALLPGLIVDFKRQLYRDLLQEFSGYFESTQ
jgi:putative (di)nucleoside polyphosphate hydrolase